MLADVSVNWLAILVAAVVNMVLGALWYAPFLFGKAWMEEMGDKVKEMKPSPARLLGMFIIALGIGYIMTHFVAYAGAADFAMGMETGIWAALGFTVLTAASATFAADGSWKLWLINNGYWVVSLALMGGVLASMH